MDRWKAPGTHEGCPYNTGVGRSGPAAGAVTDESGYCVLDGVAPGRGVLTVRHPEFAPVRMEADFPEADGLLRVAMGRGLSVPVKALGETPGEADRPMAIILRGRTRGEVPPRVWAWPLDEAGRGAMDRLPAEDVEIELLAAGCSPVVVRTADLAAGKPLTVRFRLLPRPPD